jgi:coatomer subunit beta'
VVRLSPFPPPIFRSINSLPTDLKELALQITTDPDHKFDLALSLDDLDTALQITHTIPENESEIKWKALGDRALTVWRFDLAKECFENAGDLSALMLLLVAMGDRDGLKVLAAKAGMCVFFFGPFFFFFFFALAC